MKKKNSRILCVLIMIIMLVISTSKAYARSTDYPEKKERKDANKDKAVGVAVLEKKGVKDVNSYFYLYYDNEGEVHIVQYIENPMKSEEKKRWILKTDADNIKAKELGAKEYYKEEDEIKNDENSEATKLYKDIVKATGNSNSLYDYIEGATEDQEPYSIKNMILNKVPLFDANFFSETPGGKELNEGSIEAIVRQYVAVWYVTFRNIALVILAILIIYYGIRLAISSIASEKAQYKSFLIGWLKSLIIILFMHYIMYAILYANESFISVIMTSDKNESSLYNTIQTRALEEPLKIAIPAIIMYLVLLFIWVKFIIVYFKRLFTVAFLIILAPLVGIRYAVESGKGKGSSLVANWIQRFATAVFIQSVHALIYCIFVESAVEIALVDLKGFFIALFLLHFMLSTDDIFIKIFSFEFNPDVFKQIRQPFKPATDLIELRAGLEIGKQAVGIATNIGSNLGHAVTHTLNKGYTGVMDALDDKLGGNHKKDFEDAINGIKDSIDDRLMFSETDKDGNKKELGKIRTDINNRIKLRKLSRVRGLEGLEAKKKLKLKRDLRKRRFSSEFKFVSGIVGGLAGMVFAIPVAVTSEDSSKGIFLMTQSVSTLMDTSPREMRKIRNKIRKANKEIDDTINSINSENSKFDKIEKELDKLEKDDKTRRKTTSKKKHPKPNSATETDINSIKSSLYRILKRRKFEIRSDDLDKLIVKIIDNMDIDLTDEQKDNIKNNAKSIIIKKHAASLQAEQDDLNAQPKDKSKGSAGKKQGAKSEDGDKPEQNRFKSIEDGVKTSSRESDTNDNSGEGDRNIRSSVISQVPSTNIETIPDNLQAQDGAGDLETESDDRKEGKDIIDNSETIIGDKEADEKPDDVENAQNSSYSFGEIFEGIEQSVNNILDSSNTFADTTSKNNRFFALVRAFGETISDENVSGEGADPGSSAGSNSSVTSEINRFLDSLNQEE